MTQTNNNGSVDNLMDQGRDLLNKANRRHVIIRRADGTQLADISMTVLAIIIVAIFMFQPLGTFIAIGTIAYGIYNKVKIEVVNELTSDDEVVEVNLEKEEQ